MFYRWFSTRLDCLTVVFVTCVTLTAISLADSKYVLCSNHKVFVLTRSRPCFTRTVINLCNQLNGFVFFFHES